MHRIARRLPVQFSILGAKLIRTVIRYQNDVVACDHAQQRENGDKEETGDDLFVDLLRTGDVHQKFEKRLSIDVVVLVIGPERVRERALLVYIQDKDIVSTCVQRPGKVDRRGRLPSAAFLVLDRDDPGSTRFLTIARFMGFNRFSSVGRFSSISHVISSPEIMKRPSFNIKMRQTAVRDREWVLLIRIVPFLGVFALETSTAGPATAVRPQ